MEKSGLKRPRSDDMEYFVPQRKTYISEKVMNNKDKSKMNQVHEKTIKLLFNAARGCVSRSEEEDESVDVPLWQQIRLSGNGEVTPSHPNDLTQDIDARLELAKANCCQRDAYLRDKCSNCTMPLCEYCGFSCDCGNFLCHSCVAVFGSGTIDNPMCDRCQLFNRTG